MAQLSNVYRVAVMGVAHFTSGAHFGMPSPIPHDNTTLITAIGDNALFAKCFIKCESVCGVSVL